MPLLLSKQITPHTWLGVWQSTETEEELRAALPLAAGVQALGEHVHPRRRREWLASRVLVYALLPYFTPTPLTLAKNPYGKPYFPGQPLHVSITHSPKLAAVILSDRHEVGIDIELITAKALRVADKFLTEDEKSHTSANETKACLYWSAKETLYKLYSRKSLLWKDNLHVYPGAEPDVLMGRVQTASFSKLYEIRHEQLQGHVLTYSIDQEPH